MSFSLAQRARRPLVVNSKRFCLSMACLVMTLAAQPSAAEPGGTPTAEEAAVNEFRRGIKDAWKDGLVHGNTRTFLETFTRKPIITVGRHGTPDFNDYVLSKTAFAFQIRGKWKKGRSGLEKVIFRRFDAQLRRGEIESEFEIFYQFFGGFEHANYRIRAKRSKRSGWVISEMRTWKTQETTGAQSEKLDETFWKEADEAALTTVLTPQARWQNVFSAMVKARWKTTALRYVKSIARSRKTDVEAWKAEASLSLELGKIADAKRAKKRAKRLDPSISMPWALE